jgi:hypothetical protein
LLGLALFFAAEHELWSDGRLLELVARYTPPGPDGDPLRSAALVARLGRERGGAVPILLLGSSQVREGLDCAVFERVLPGRPCANLAIGAGSPLDMLYVERRFAGRVPRRVVVLGIFPKVMHMAPKDAFLDRASLSCLLKGGAWNRIGARGWVDVVYGLLQSLSPSLRHKDALYAARDVVAGRWSAAWQLRLPPQPSRLMAGRPPQPAQYYAALLGRLDGDFPVVGPYTGAQEQALERLLRSESEAGQLVLVVDFPTRPGYETTLPEAALRHYEAVLARLAARRDVVFVPRARLPELAEADFLDFTHLAESGRARVSERLAELIAGAEQSPAVQGTVRE